MRKFFTFLVAAAIAVSFSTDAHAGAWTVPKYNVWIEYYQKFTWAHEQFTAEGDRAELPRDARSWGYEITPKFEYGLTDWLSAVGSISFFESFYKEYDRPAAWGSYSVNNSGVSSYDVGGKLRILKDPVVLSVQTKAFFWPHYEISRAPGAGKGDDACELRGFIAKNFDLPLYIYNYKLPSYVNCEAAYKWRSRDVANDIILFYEVGARPFQYITVKTELDTIRSHPHTGKQLEDWGIWRIGGTYHVFGDSTRRQGKVFNLEFLYGKVIWGKNTTAFHEFILKAQTQF